MTSLEFELRPGRWVWREEEITYRQRYWKTVERTFYSTYRQRYWKTRKDGVRQRYWKKVRRPYKKKVKQRYWKKITRTVRRRVFEPFEYMWRHTMGMNIVERHNYMSFTVQYWSMEPDLTVDEYEMMHDELVNVIERWLGYDKIDWWFEDAPSTAHEEVEYDERLIGTTETYGPDPADSRWPLTEFSVRFARRMFEVGRWFTDDAKSVWMPRIEEWERLQAEREEREP